MNRYQKLYKRYRKLGLNRQNAVKLVEATLNRKPVYGLRKSLGL